MRLKSVLLGACLMAAATSLSAGEKLWVYFGTYTRGDSKGIYRSEFDLETGKLSEAELAAELKNPSFLAIHPDGSHLYAVSEVSDTDGKPVGGVVGFQLDPPSGKLEKLNGQSTGGAGPCHLIVDPTGQNVLAANYGGGSVVCLPLKEDGTLGEASSFIQHEGASVNKSRQSAPHAHSINTDPSNRFAVAADLGLDKLLVYAFDPATGSLKPNDPAFVKTPLGGGPRHFAFHPSGKFAYTNNEILLSATAFEFNAERGILNPIQTISTVPEGTPLQGNSTAEIRVHPNGKFLYVSNRGPNSIAVFSIEPNTGLLANVGIVPSGGKIPRNFNLTPDGKWLLAAHQDSDNIVVF
ncbi:MAG TPA: lactonase family protein, partial [Planctomycetaceae bacterium]|nr:lactonase family protein [Planctomycetaceae bacterium]